MSLGPTDSLAVFINKRSREITSEARRLLFEIKKMQEELLTLEKAARAAGIHFTYEADVFGDLSVPTGTQENKRARARKPPVAPQVTIQSATIEVLKETGHALTAMELLPKINKRLGIEYPRSSLSPQLSRLKQRDIVKLIGNKWALCEWAPQTVEASGDLLKGIAPEASEHEPEAKGREAGPGGGT